MVYAGSDPNSEIGQSIENVVSCLSTYGADAIKYVTEHAFTVHYS